MADIFWLVLFIVICLFTVVWIVLTILLFRYIIEVTTGIRDPYTGRRLK